MFQKEKNYSKTNFLKIIQITQQQNITCLEQLYSFQINSFNQEIKPSEIYIL